MRRYERVEFCALSALSRQPGCGGDKGDAVHDSLSPNGALPGRQLLAKTQGTTVIG